MTSERTRLVLWGRTAAAVASGLALAAAFPNGNLTALAWLAPGMMLLSALGLPGRAAFRLGYLASLAHYLASLYWLLFIPFPSGAVMGWLALSAYLALWPAAWVWLSLRLLPAAPALQPAGLRNLAPAAAGLATSAGARPWRDAAEGFASALVGRRLGWAVICAALWVAMEMLLGRVLTGFPWNFLGASQSRVLPLVQTASIAGVYGVSFLVVWFSVALAAALLLVIRRPGQRLAWLTEVTPPILALGGALAFGFHQLLQPMAGGRELRVVLVQPSIPQTLIFDARESTNRFHKLVALTELAAATRPDLVIWPEAAVPNVLRYDEALYRSVTNLAIQHRAWMILGADDASPRPAVEGRQEYDFFNSSFLISPEGRVMDTYRKRRLVIFGEYVPLARWLPMLRHLTPIEGGFTPGDRPGWFRLTPLNLTVSMLICFEDVFPDLARASVGDDTDLLVNLTNNGWFGESAAQWQHAASAVFRAVENGVPLIRCTNNGLTCWVDPRGGLHEVYFGETKDIYGEGFKTARVPLPQAGGKRRTTFYRQHGDWFGWSCVGLAALVLALQKGLWPRRLTTAGCAGDRGRRLCRLQAVGSEKENG